MLPMLRLLGFALCCVAIFSAIPMRSQAADFVFGPNQYIQARPGGVYVNLVDPLSLTGVVEEYSLPNTKNARAKCQVGLPNYALPIGIAVSPQGILYVPSEMPQYDLFGAGFPVYTFQPNCGGPGATLLQQFGRPTDVATDKKTGEVYVSFYNPDSKADGTLITGILKFDLGTIYPTDVLTNPDSPFESGTVAVTSHGDVWATGAFTIIEFPGARQEARRLRNLVGLNSPYGLEFDRNDNLIVTDGAGGSAIDVYAPPYNSAPRLRIKRTSQYYSFVKLDAANHTLYASDSTRGVVDVYAYPSGKYAYSFTSGMSATHEPFGLAVDP